MTIGGIDIVIPAKTSKNLVAIIIEKMIELWPDAIFQDHNSDAQLSIRLYPAFLPAIAERHEIGFFIYKNDYVALSWDAQSELKNMMLYFLIDYKHKDENYITLVCDEEDDFINNLVKWFSLNLQN